MKDLTLTREQIIEAIKAVRGGTIARITYKTDVPIKAEFKKQGYRIYKIVETSARIGVNYGNISTVKERRALEGDKPTTRTNNYEWIIRNRISHNSNTGKDYVALTSFNKGHHTKIKYVIEGTFVGTIDMGDTIENAYRHIVLDSYWKRQPNATEFRNVAFENVIRINNVGTKLIF